MGWSGGDDIVDPVIRYLVNAVHHGPMPTEDAYGVLAVLIRACQGRDWDTEEETLGEWRYIPWVVRAFAKCEVYCRCGETAFLQDDETTPFGQNVECGLPQGHTVDHFDDEEMLEWPIVSR
jgi:hypothetical protein